MENTEKEMEFILPPIEKLTILPFPWDGSYIRWEQELNKLKLIGAPIGKSPNIENGC
jgi:hypothetical protein